MKPSCLLNLVVHAPRSIAQKARLLRTSRGPASHARPRKKAPPRVPRRTGHVPRRPAPASAVVATILGSHAGAINDDLCGSHESSTFRTQFGNVVIVIRRIVKIHGFCPAQWRADSAQAATACSPRTVPTSHFPRNLKPKLQARCRCRTGTFRIRYPRRSFFFEGGRRTPGRG